MRFRYSFTITILTFCLLQTSAISGWGREGTEAAGIFGFAESLYEEGDYFRAIGEYKRYQFLYPAGDLAETAAIRIAESYFKARRWQEAIDACALFLVKFPDSPRYFEILYLKGRLEKLDKQYSEALRTFDAIISAGDRNYSDKAVYQKALVMLERSDWRGTRDFLLQVPAGSPLHSTASAFLAHMEEAEKIPQKSPRTAGILAAVLPGAGHLYTERPRDALMAFLLNGAFIWGAVELFRDDKYAAGGILAFFEIGWYSGNIYSAISSAHKYNREKEEEFTRAVKERFSLSFHRQNEANYFLLTKRF